MLIGLVGQAGRVSAQADFLNFFAPVWLSAGVVAAAVLLFIARKRRTRLGAAGAIVALGAIALTFRPPIARGADDAGDCPVQALRLVQFNLLKQNRTVPSAVAWIEGTEADVVTLEEAAGELRVVDLLRPYFPYVQSCAPRMRCSTIILSRRPFLASGALARGDPEDRKALSAAWATVATRGGSFTIVAAHLGRPWPWHNRSQDLAQLTAFVRSRGDRTTLLAGDFNLPSWSFQLRRLTEDFGISRAPDIRSWPATSVLPPLLDIDHVLFGRRWRIERVVRGPKLGSDHYPLLADLRLHAQGCGSPDRGAPAI